MTELSGDPHQPRGEGWSAPGTPAASQQPHGPCSTTLAAGSLPPLSRPCALSVSQCKTPGAQTLARPVHCATPVVPHYTLRPQSLMHVYCIRMGKTVGLKATFYVAKATAIVQERRSVEAKASPALLKAEVEGSEPVPSLRWYTRTGLK